MIAKRKTYILAVLDRQYLLCSATAIVLVFAGAFTAGAQNHVEFDTIAVHTVGPGVQHVELVAPSMPWMLDVMTVNLKHPSIEIETADAQMLVSAGYETTSSMAMRNDSAGHRVIGAINGDFYKESRPVGIFIQNGEIVRDDADGSRPAIGFNADDHPMMQDVTYSGTVVTRNGETNITGINESRAAGDLVLYNHYWGPSTRTNQFGTEAAIVPLETSRWLVNDTIHVVVQRMAEGKGNLPVPFKGAVLSGHGKSAAYLNNSVAVGDTIGMMMNAVPGIQGVEDMIAGWPMIVRDGKVDVGPRGDRKIRHPRTAIGISENGTILFLVTVDGRQQNSVGMTLLELGRFMRSIGSDRAMNVDGGGSSTMIVRGIIVNSPSDNEGERSIGSNALLIISTANKAYVK